MHDMLEYLEGRTSIAGSGGATSWAVSTCDSCRSAPSAVYCRADAAALCTACDADVHSANPLARRHHRVPIGQGNVGGLVVRAGVAPSHHNYSASGNVLDDNDGDKYDPDNDDDDVTSSWLLLDSFGGAGEVEKFLDIGSKDGGSDGSSHKEEDNSEFMVPSDHYQHQFFQMEETYEDSKISFGFNPHLGLSASLPDASAVVPDASHPPEKVSLDFSSAAAPAPVMPQQLAAMDREARVLRYREKRKNRRFEKTIRYASRKAYAETRPRIKGRFAKRSDVDLEVDQYFSAAAFAGGKDDSFSVVPSF